MSHGSTKGIPLDTDGTLSNNSDQLVATQKAVKTYVDTSIAASPSGTVTSVSVVSANGVSASVANATTTPAITVSLGNITPASVASTGNVTGLNLSGTNTGDQTSIVGITGTKAQFDTACTDGNFAYASDLAGYQPLDTQLTDLAGLSYAGNSLKAIRVNAGETGFELATITATTPDMILTKLSMSTDQTVTAGYSAIIAGRFTIGSGTRLTIGNLARFKAA